MLNVNRGWKVGLMSHPGGNKCAVVAHGAVIFLTQDGNRQFLGNGNVIGVGHNHCSVVCIEDTTIIEITHGVVGPDIDCKYVGWHIGYHDPLNKIMSINQQGEAT
jgi:hypothetical protein